MLTKEKLVGMFNPRKLVIRQCTRRNGKQPYKERNISVTQTEKLRSTLYKPTKLQTPDRKLLIYIN